MNESALFQFRDIGSYKSNNHKICFLFSWAFTYWNFSWYNLGTLCKNHSRNTMPTGAKIIPYLTFLSFPFIMLFYYFISIYAYLWFTLSISFTYFQLIRICYIKHTSQCKILIEPEEGWFGQPKYSTPSKKTFYVVSVFASIFFIVFKYRKPQSPTLSSGTYMHIY